MKKFVGVIIVFSIFVAPVLGSLFYNAQATTETKTENEVVHYQTKTIYDNTLREGIKKTTTEGKDGLQSVTYLYTYNHGKLVKKEKKSSAIITKPIDKVITVGTKKYYTCSDGTEYDTLEGKNECEKYISWKKTRDQSLNECNADPDKFDCWYDEYPGTTLHWSYWVYNYTPSYNYPSNNKPYSPSTRSGAVCKDGWTSHATGSGACSHHGGVSYWF